MSNENCTEVAKEISDRADKQVLSHIIMVLKQRIEVRLKKNGDANSEFENRVKALYGNDAVKCKNVSDHKAYINVEGIDIKNSGMKTFARVFPKIDKVLSVNNNQDVSYALHLKITSGNGTPAYDENGFIREDCWRFAVGHDIGDIVLNLKHLIKCAIADGAQSKDDIPNDKDNIPKHYQSDFFSYMLSDLRDYDLLGFRGQLNLNKVFENYKLKAEEKINEALNKEVINNDKIEEEKAKRFEEVKNVFEKSVELHSHSGHCNISMAYSVFALKEVIAQRLNSHTDSRLKDMRNRLEDDEEYENILKELSELDKEKSRISIHLINKRDFIGEPTINCYNRKDCGTGKNLYCFEIIINQFPEENEVKDKEKKEDITRRKICQAIGCIYFGYRSIIEKINDGHYNDTVSRTIEKCNLDQGEIDGLATDLYDLRDSIVKGRIQHLKNEKKLVERLTKSQ